MWTIAGAAGLGDARRPLLMQLRIAIYFHVTFLELPWVLSGAPVEGAAGGCRPVQYRGRVVKFRFPGPSMGECGQRFPPLATVRPTSAWWLCYPTTRQGLGLEPVRTPCAVCMARHGCRALSPTRRDVGSWQRHGMSQALGRGPQAFDHHTIKPSVRRRAVRR